MSDFGYQIDIEIQHHRTSAITSSMDYNFTPTFGELTFSLYGLLFKNSLGIVPLGFYRYKLASHLASLLNAAVIVFKGSECQKIEEIVNRKS